MAKIRKMASIESGLMQVTKILSEEEIQEAIKEFDDFEIELD